MFPGPRAERNHLKGAKEKYEKIKWKHKNTIKTILRCQRLCWSISLFSEVILVYYFINAHGEIQDTDEYCSGC